MGNLFSTFDPNVTIFHVLISFNWISSLRILFFLPPIFWAQKRILIKTVEIISKYINSELGAVFGNFTNPGLKLIFISIFFFILMINVLGLLPYVFTSSRHVSFSLSLSLPLWVGYIILGFTLQFNDTMGHLVPEGTPAILIPLMVVIESVSLLIRPFTLSVRLRANIIAGHLLLSLLGGQGYGVNTIVLLVLMSGLRMLILLECAVACIQSYVFTILSSLYINDNNSKKINSWLF